MATSTLPTGGMIDPTKQAEYPVLLGDMLAEGNGFSRPRLFNFNYNYKTKSASSEQRSTVTRSSESHDLYNLAITDKAPNAENLLTYLYEGSVDPQIAQEPEVQDYVLVFDSERKAFVLEPVGSRLNFNLRSTPAKTKKQVVEQYEQLRTLQEDQHSSGEEQVAESSAGDEDGPADDSNPFDFRHFLPKDGDDKEKPAVDHALSDSMSNASKSDTPPMPAATKPAPSAKRPKSQTNPLRQKKKEPTKKKAEPIKKEESKKEAEPPAPKPSPKPEAQIEIEDVGKPESKSTPSDTGTAALDSHKTVPSPGSNIIVDGDLIIDMGSPPPTRPAFNINPAHFSSNGTPANGAEDEDDEEMEDLRLPSPAGHPSQPEPAERQEAAPTAPAKEEEVEDDDALAAEMEAAFEASAQEEDTTHGQPYQQQSRQYNAASEDESEVSEEE